MSSGRTSTLNTGAKIPTLGYGTWQSAPGEVGTGIYEALKAGYRHLDLAKVYNNQKEVGEGIKKALAEVPGLKREDIFITSKLWNTHHHPKNVGPALDDTLQELGLEYLDLYLIHWPVPFSHSNETMFPRAAANPESTDIVEDVTLTETWKAMTMLPKEKTRAVGVSNFQIPHLETIIQNTGVVPAMNQIERHPRLPNKELVEYCTKKGIFTTAYSAFGNNGEGLPLLIAEPEIKAIAERLSKSSGKDVSAAHVILAWAQRDGQIVIPKSVTPSRIRDNFQEHEIDDEALKTLEKFGNPSKRFNIPANYKPKWDINIFDDAAEKSATHKVLS